MRPEEVHVPPARAIGPHDVRPPSVGLASGRRPADPRGGAGSVARGRTSSGTPRPRDRRRLVETRNVPSGSPGGGSPVAVFPGGETPELPKALPPLRRR